MGAFTKVTSFWTGLSGPGRRLIIGAVVIFLIGAFLLTRFSGEQSWSTVQTVSDASETSAVVADLEEKGIPHRLQDGGTVIQVPSDQVDEAIINLSSAGHQVGLESIDSGGIAPTDFQQRVALLRARQGELSRLLTRLGPVDEATVTLGIPDESRFIESERDPVTASVVLELGAATLDPAQVKAMTSLVANSVPGLKTADITISDTDGNELVGAGGDATGTTAAQQRLKLQTVYEDSLETKVDKAIADYLGPGKATAQVNAVLDLDQRTVEQNDYDGAQATPLSERTKTENLESAGGAGGTPAGAAANTPGSTFAQAGGGGGDTTYTNNETTRQNGVDQTRTSTEVAPGEVKRLTAAVQVSDAAVSAEQLAVVEDTVKGAIGFEDGRDAVTVKSVAFAEDAAAPAEAQAATEDPGAGAGSSGSPIDMMNMVKIGAAAIGLLVLLMLARKALRRRQGELERALPELLERGPVAVADLPGEGPRQLSGQVKSKVELEMEDLAKRKPDDVAQLIRGWLLDGR